MAVARGRQAGLAQHISNQAHRCFSAGRAGIPLTTGSGASPGPSCTNASVAAAGAGGSRRSRDLSVDFGAWSCSLFSEASPSPLAPTRQLSGCILLSDDRSHTHGGTSVADGRLDRLRLEHAYSRGEHSEGGRGGGNGGAAVALGGSLLSSSPAGEGSRRRSIARSRVGAAAAAGEGNREAVSSAPRSGMLLTPRRDRRGREGGWLRWQAAASGVSTVAGRGGGGGSMRWRGFASANSPPEQYLRYIHRVNTETPKEAQEEDEEERGSDVRGELSSSTQPSVPSMPVIPPSQVNPVVGGVGGGADGKGVSSVRSSVRVEEDSDGEEEEEEGNPGSDRTRRWLKGFTAEDIVRDKTLLRQQLEVQGNCTVDEAVTAFVNQKVTSFVVVNRRKEVIGMFTSRDLLGELARYPNKADGLKTKAHEFMIPLSRMIYCSPKDSLYQCLLVMSELKVRNLPVVSEGKVMGIVNVNDISDFSFSMEELGGKKAYMKNISQRKGLPKGVGLDPGQNRSGWKQKFSASVGAVALPHPHKMQDGRVSASMREHRHLEIADDPTLSEDAHFVLDVVWPTQTTDTVHYVGLADGVGSWRKLGVDPREFSYRLMHWAREYIVSMAPGSGLGLGDGGHLSPPPPKPHQVLMAAWEYTIGEKVVGSSTACVAALDYDLEQLTFSNIGDCGVVVLRHIDSDVAGYMREKKTPRYLRDSDLRLAFISQQQLRSFNLPYQFGYTNVPEDNANFETPRDAVNTSFPVRPGDIIILATDGLFDNMELENISSVALEWEYKWFGGPMMGLSDHNNAAMEDLAEQLGHRARELSLDNTRDSPFSLLAKENDIMWGGGMPDDITVVALRVINRAGSSAAAVSTRGVGPDDHHVEEVAAA